MTKLALYEQNEGKEDIKLSKYYKSDYVRYNVLKTCIGVTVAYLLILLMIAVYYSEYFIREISVIDYKAIGEKALAVYIIILTVYIIGAIIGYGMKYEKSRRRLAHYYKKLKSLEKLYHNSGKE